MASKKKSRSSPSTRRGKRPARRRHTAAPTNGTDNIVMTGGTDNITITSAGLISTGLAPEPPGPRYVVCELRHDSCMAYSPSVGFQGPAQVHQAAASLNKLLDTFGVKKLSSHFGTSKKQISERMTNALPSLAPRYTVTAEFAHSGFVALIPMHEADVAELAKRLNRSKPVWRAEVAPRPVPAAVASGAGRQSRNFEPAQGYLHSPPDGIGAMDVWNKAGAKGHGVTVCDIEGNWNFSHEDLPALRQLGGELINGLGWKNHGTAVMGEILSKPSVQGTVGISPDARGAVHSAMIGGVFNAAAAISNAARRLRRGDVILIELHAPDPTTGRYVAMQRWDDIFSAIRAAVARGVVVVEAAGNGGQNFDAAVYRNTGLQKDAGAIVVGAGIPPTNFMDHDGDLWGVGRYGRIGNPRSRIWFSNYGKIVNVQGWGWHVTTTGYGDAQGGTDQNRWYTLRFSGTSSASPIVTGAVACIQGRHKAKHAGRTLSPQQILAILMRTGTPQQPGPGVPVRQRIGPQPNLVRAFRKSILR